MADTTWNKYDLGGLAAFRRAAYQVNGNIVFWQPLHFETTASTTASVIREISASGDYSEDTVVPFAYYSSPLNKRGIFSNSLTYIDRLTTQTAALNFIGFFASKPSAAYDNKIPNQNVNDTFVYARRFYTNPVTSGDNVPATTPPSLGSFDNKNILISSDTYAPASTARTCTNISSAFALSTNGLNNRNFVVWVVRTTTSISIVGRVIDKNLSAYGDEIVLFSGPVSGATSEVIYCPARTKTAISGNMLRVIGVDGDGSAGTPGFFLVTFFTKIGANNYIRTISVGFESGTPKILSNIRTGVVSPAARYSVLFSKKNRKFYFSMIAENNQSYSSVFSEGANAAMSTNTNVKDVLIRDSNYRFFSFNSAAASTVNVLDENLALKNTVQIPAPIPTNGGMLTSSNQLMLHGDPGITIYNLSSISRSNLDDSLSLAEIINPNGEHSVTSLLD